jgi:hypothetical protein
MELYYHSQDIYEVSGNGLIEFLNTYNLNKQFNSIFKEQLKELKELYKDDIKSSKEELLNHFIEDRYDFDSVLTKLFDSHPEKFPLNCGINCGYVWDIDDNNEWITITWYEAQYPNKEEAVSLMVKLIRQHGIETADIFEEVLKTS